MKFVVDPILKEINLTFSVRKDRSNVRSNRSKLFLRDGRIQDNWGISYLLINFHCDLVLSKKHDNFVTHHDTVATVEGVWV